MIKIIALLAAVLFVPCAAGAAELPVPKLHRVHRRVVHRVRAAHTTKPHFGYYFARWGWRRGGTACSWYGSTFVFAGVPGWDEAATVAASPKGIAVIDCPDWRPDVCLAEPVLAPLTAAAWMRR